AARFHLAPPCRIVAAFPIVRPRLRVSRPMVREACRYRRLPAMNRPGGAQLQCPSIRRSRRSTPARSVPTPTTISSSRINEAGEEYAFALPLSTPAGTLLARCRGACYTVVRLTDSREERGAASTYKAKVLGRGGVAGGGAGGDGRRSASGEVPDVRDRETGSLDKGTIVARSHNPTVRGCQ